jgi:hypothetical protein
MYIVNQYNVLHSVPDDWAVPEKARKATDKEISAFEATEKVKTTKSTPIDLPNLSNLQAKSTVSGGWATTPVKQPTDYAKVTLPKGKNDD